jgi:hypothetical protein
MSEARSNDAADFVRFLIVASFHRREAQEPNPLATE